MQVCANTLRTVPTTFNPAAPTICVTTYVLGGWGGKLSFELPLKVWNSDDKGDVDHSSRVTYICRLVSA